MKRVRPADVMAFITALRSGGNGAVPPPVEDEGALVGADGPPRLSSVSVLYGYLLGRGDVAVNPVPRGWSTRREGQRPHQGVPLLRTVRTLPRVLESAEVDALLAALRTSRDRALVTAMVLGGLRAL